MYNMHYHVSHIIHIWKKAVINVKLYHISKLFEFIHLFKFNKTCFCCLKESDKKGETNCHSLSYYILLNSSKKNVGKLTYGTPELFE